MKAFILLSIILLMFSGCGKNDDTSSASSNSDYSETDRKAVAVETMEVTHDRLVPWLELSGTVQGKNEVSLLSQTQGTVTDVFAGPGSKVRKGDALVKVDDSLAWLNFKAADEQVKTAEITFNALGKSLEQGGASKKDYSAAREDLARSRAALESARQAYENCTIRSPIDGAVSDMDRSVSKGNTLSAGMKVARIIDTSAWVIEGSIGEDQLQLIATGMPASVLVPSADDDNEQASIMAISSGADPATGSYSVTVEWTSENDNIRSGMAASVRIPTADDKRTLIIPRSAVVRRNRGNYVFIVENGKAAALPVETGKSLGNRLEVTSGLEGGEQLIISGLNSLAPEIPVLATPVSREEALE